MTGRQTGPVDLGIAGITDAVEIGAGGFGIVYRAVEADLGRTVAVKVLSGNLDESAQYRFERERRAMGRLSGHPNIVTIYRGGYTSAGNAYLVMEFLDRGSLADRLTTAGPLGWEEALMFGVQLSGALETSHRAGVLHRDIKPGNILLSSLGNAKLCDFGIARLQGAPETKSSVVTASLSHAPPDIVSGARPDARSDVYSLASTLFELVAAMPPFVRADDESMVPILARIARDPVPRLPETQLPTPVFEVIERAMAKDPDDRPSTAVELGSLLAAAQQRLGLPATTIPIETVGPDGDSGRSGYIPFPDTPSGPLPAPSARSPHTGPGPTGPAGQDATGTPAPTGQSAPPTVVTSPSTPSGHEAPPSETFDSGPLTVSQETVVSGQHDPSTWAPPTTSDGAAGSPIDPAGTAGIDGGAGSGPGSGQVADGGLPRWLVPAAVAVVAVLAIGGAVLALGGDDDTAATTSQVDGATGNGEAEDPETDDGDPDDDPDDDGDDTTGETVPGQSSADYPFYETITDSTGSITVNVPTEWDDRLTGIGLDELPQITAAPIIDGGFVGTYDEPGVQITVAALADDLEIDLDTALDQTLDGFAEPDCTTDNRRDINFPFPGRVERFSDCGGGDTRIVHIAYIDDPEGLVAVLRIQVVDERDDVAVDTIRSSLELEDNVPE